MTNILTAKGAILSNDGTNDAQLNVGLDKNFLGADSTQSAGLSWRNIGFDLLSDVAVSAVTRSSDNAVNQRQFNLQPADMILLNQPSTIGHAFSNSFFVKRTANYSAGVSGWVNAAIYAKTSALNGTNSFEWAIVGVLNNSGQGQNVGGYFQGNRITSAASTTWGAVAAVNDFTGGSAQTVGLEVDHFSNGADANGGRVVADFVIGKANVSGLAPTVQSFTRSINVFDDSAQGNVNVAHYTKSNILNTVYESYNTYDLPASAGNTLTFVKYAQKTGANISRFKIDHIRAQNGSNWDTSNMRFYREVDGTTMGSVEFRNLTDLTFNRSIALTMDNTDFFEANLLRNMAVFKNPINMVSQSANPASGVPNAYFNALPNSGEANQYIKGGKLVWQYNDAGTIRYLSIPLTGTGTTFTHSTTAP